MVFHESILEYYRNDQTIGKKGANIRVAKKDGSNIGANEAIVRNILVIALMIPYAKVFMYIAGLIGMADSDKRQRIFDRLADTAIIRDRS